MVYKEPTKKVFNGVNYYFHTAHATKREAEEMQSWLKRKHPRKYGSGKTLITEDERNWKLWAVKWW